MEEILKILLIIGVYQGLVTAVILFTRKTNRLPNRFLSMLMVLFSLPMLDAYIIINKLWIYIDIILKYLVLPTATLFGPLVYFYTYNMINIDKPIRIRKFLPHAIPFIIAMIMLNSILYHWNQPVTSFREIKIMVSNYKAFFICFFIFNPISGLTYTLIAYHKVIRHTKSILDYYSDIERISLLWLKKFLTFLLIFFTIIIVFHGSRLVFFIEKEFFIIIPITALCVIFMTSYYVFNQPDIFSAIREMHQEIEEESEDNTFVEETQKYKKHNLEESTALQYVEKLKDYMQTQKPHLNDSLTLKELADFVNIPSHHLSIVLNQYLEQNFYNFISYYRIESAMELLKSEHYADVPVLKIAFDSGFNSKSAFNNLFKKSTGKTPTQYRNDYFSGGVEKVS